MTGGPIVKMSDLPTMLPTAMMERLGAPLATRAFPTALVRRNVAWEIGGKIEGFVEYEGKKHYFNSPISGLST